MAIDLLFYETVYVFLLDFSTIDLGAVVGGFVSKLHILSSICFFFFSRIFNPDYEAYASVVSAALAFDAVVLILLIITLAKPCL